MNILIRHIEYLISRTDCVIIPGLGTILAQYDHAVVDADNSTVYAPHRKFTFNSSITRTDGTLACSVARSLGVSYEAAVDRICSEVTAMQQQLRSHGELALGRIGTLAYDSDTNTTEFTPYPTDCLSVNTAWLPATVTNSTHIEAEEPEKEPIRIVPISPWARFARIAASIALLIGICFVASTPISVDEAALASLTPEIKQVAVEDFLPSDPCDFPSLRVYTSHPSYLSISTESEYVSEADNGRYCIIIGSFTTQSDAINYIEKNKQQELKYFESKGRYRVYAAAFDSEIEAYSYLSKAPFAGSGAWVCRK